MITQTTQYQTNSQTAAYVLCDEKKTSSGLYYIPDLSNTALKDTCCIFIWNSNSVENNFNIELFMFLHEHDLIDAYSSGLHKIYQYFEDAIISNEIYSDIENGNNKLFIVIKTKLNQREAFKRLVEMRKDWAETNSPIFYNNISITTETL